MPSVKPHLDGGGGGEGAILIGALPSLVTNCCNVYSSKQARLYWSKLEDAICLSLMVYLSLLTM